MLAGKYKSNIWKIGKVIGTLPLITILLYLVSGPAAIGGCYFLFSQTQLFTIKLLQQNAKRSEKSLQTIQTFNKSLKYKI